MTYAITDHTIEGLSWCYKLIEEGIVEEMLTGKYKKVTDCPGYKEYRAVQKAQFELSKVYYKEEYVEVLKEENRRQLKYLREDVLEKVEDLKK